MRTLRVSFVLPLLLAFAASVGAQSLADVSRREGARRKQIKNPSRVITNKDLRPSEGAPPPPPPPAAQASAPAAPEGATPAGSEVSDDRSQMYLDALQSKLNALWADFTARDDPAQRGAIETERKKALAEFDRVKLEIESNKKAIDDLEEEARRAGVPAGWLR
jgi:hypothetical protein